MTVKMDKYELVEGTYFSRSGKSFGIRDNRLYEVIITFDTNSKEANEKFARMILDELNTGKYEGDFND